MEYPQISCYKTWHIILNKGIKVVAVYFYTINIGSNINPITPLYSSHAHY